MSGSEISPEGKVLGFNCIIEPSGNANAKGLLTIFYTTNGAPVKDHIRKDVLRVTEPYVSGSVEQKQNLKDYALASGYGCYCLLTDASLVGKKTKPGDYKVMAPGEIQPADNVVGVVTLFADEADGAEMKAMIKMINGVRIK